MAVSWRAERSPSTAYIFFSRSSGSGGSRALGRASRGGLPLELLLFNRLVAGAMVKATVAAGAMEEEEAEAVVAGTMEAAEGGGRLRSDSLRVLRYAPDAGGTGGRGNERS